MTAKTLDLNLVPGALRIAKVSFGVASDSPDVVIAASDVGASLVPLFTVPVGTVVRDLVINKRSAFGSTGSPTMDFGDTDADGFIESTDAVMSDAGVVSMLGMQHGSTGAPSNAAYRNGRVYASGDTLNIGVTIATAPINAGLADAYLMYFVDGEL